MLVIWRVCLEGCIILPQRLKSTLFEIFWFAESLRRLHRIPFPVLGTNFSFSRRGCRMRDWRPLLLSFFCKIFCTFFAKKLQNILQNFRIFCKIFARNVQKRFFFCVNFLPIWNLHTDFRPREESVSFYEINYQMILPIC